MTRAERVREKHRRAKLRLRSAPDAPTGGEPKLLTITTGKVTTVWLYSDQLAWLRREANRRRPRKLSVSATVQEIVDEAMKASRACRT